jgi:hypothetical protein
MCVCVCAKAYDDMYYIWEEERKSNGEIYRHPR